MLRKQGIDVGSATSRLERLSVSDKNELLYQQAGINFNDLPAWQKRGVGLYWETYHKEASSPITGQTVLAERRRVKTDLNLPMKDDYSDFIRELLLREHSPLRR
jgi:tRNA(His) guanylyltransferase